MELNERLRELRKEQGETQKQVAAARKENGPCTVQKKRTLLAATLHGRAKLLYGGWREMVPACLRGLANGRGGVRYRLER